MLAGASALVRAETGLTWLNDAGDALVDVPEEVAAIVVQVAARVWVNPQGLVSSPQGDLGSRQWASSASQGLYLTDAEKDTLSRYRAAGGRGGLFTVSSTRGECYGDTIYVPVDGSENPFPWYPGDPW